MTFCPASKCLFCDISGNYRLTNICPVCFRALQRLPHCCRQCALPLPETAEICGQCQTKPPPLDRVFAACPYDQGVNMLIRQLKDRGDFSALNLLTTLIEERLHTLGFRPPDLIIPIPMHPLKRMWRGFNQTDLLAQGLGARINIEVWNRGLGRRMTADQRNLNLKHRASNLRKAFYLRSSVEGLRIALLDDVMTTGATLNSAAKTLKAGGALRVDAWVVARTLTN